MLSKSNHRYLRRMLAGSVLLIGMLLSTGSAIAQPDISTVKDHQEYSVMLAVGYSRTAFKQADVFSGIEKSNSPQFRAQLDYRPYRHLGLSGGMNLLGSTGYRGVSLEQDGASQNGEVSSMSAELAAVGYLPLTQMSTLYARAGGAYINVRQSQVTDGVASTAHANGFSPLAGLGVEVDLQRLIAFRVGMDWYFKAGDAARLGGEGAIQAAYGGFVFRFN
ncbi:hypothetical protein KQI65_16380 [bacterium]|nr:hypothetical protein [bacterium]